MSIGPVLIAFAVGYFSHALIQWLDRLDDRDSSPPWTGDTDPRTHWDIYRRIDDGGPRGWR